jgi:glycosyltransferase involved in cell wall biosynthesis
MIVGEGNDKGRLQKRAKTERLEGIEFCGRISDAERNRMYRSCRLLFYPSRQEGFGLAGVEAASFGLPVLGLAGTVTEELFPNGTGAVMAKDLSRKSILESAVPVLKSAQHAAELGRAAAARVNAVFLREHFADRFRRALALHLSVCRVLATDTSNAQI